MIRHRLRIAVAALWLIATCISGVQFAGAQQPLGASGPVRFAAIDVYVDSAEPLAAWQFELSESTGAMMVVGVENGDSDAYATAPHYDLDAVQQDRADRIVVADYSLADRDLLPSGRTRVATVHVRLMGSGTPDFDLELIAAGNADGESIAAAANFEIADGRTQ